MGGIGLFGLLYFYLISKNGRTGWFISSLVYWCNGEHLLSKRHCKEERRGNPKPYIANCQVSLICIAGDY